MFELSEAHTMPRKSEKVTQLHWATFHIPGYCKKQTSLFSSKEQEGWSGKLQAGQSHLSPREGEGANSHRNHFQTYYGQEGDLD